MTITSVQTTENGGYVAIIDGVSYALAPGGTDAYAQAVQAWIDAGGTPAPYVPPTEQELLERLRDAARAILNAKQDLGVILRAIVIETLLYANTQRGYEATIETKFNALLTWLGGQSQLTNRGQLAAMALAAAPTQATPEQARNAILTRAGEPEEDS